ncbi:hypothetical protein HYH03_013705 [Edaphochlamys debaryana]|uniref:Kazal-like domain-containing protein n=1 Tax=Edaphochlamys debaryana TaxID=47281 RepID=A0A836BSP8_9CHLO|nr:hypothetical protein HYH03_013705 [Edaphochlamys debaryana]|eukprot:KAG2487706.1 hypothetical protein HYH03_013705 [Edaphochlamys debaryana]
MKPSEAVLLKRALLLLGVVAVCGRPEPLSLVTDPVAACQCLDHGEDTPVCGVDGKTYASACSARCARIAVAYTGACTEAPGLRFSSCKCPQDIAEVCAVGDIDPIIHYITYSNSCMAKCDDAVVLYDSACTVPYQQVRQLPVTA